MSTDSDSFSTYIDHLILILAARFHAPLEVSAEELLSTGVNLSAEAQCSWELVAQAVQQALRAPQTPEERIFVRQVDTHHFSASVCRERARYVQWQLQESRRCRRAKRSLSRLPTETSAALANTKSASSATARAAGEPDSVTPNSLPKGIGAIYALVRKSLPSTLGDSGSDDDEDAQTPAPAVLSVAPATEPLSLAGVRDVFLRTPAEQERDELVARARDEFLTRVQELQSVYYDKYHRWMDVPSSILDPPPALNKVPSTNGDAAPLETVAARRNSENERAALTDIIAATAPLPPSHSAEAKHINRSGVAERTDGPETIASMLRQMQLRRPLRPSAVSDDLLESMYGMRAESEEAPKRWSGTNGLRSFPFTTSPDTSAASVGASADTKFGNTAAMALSSPQSSSSVAAIPKETAPPASRRGRWQTVEYDDDDGED
ncbi:hypothetical protein JKF63_00071 [Porcisia hertigi]|uniref:Uncharacterized protein n=1 Tax=Porcisia hertigi TaxID=2761500 RepID=A0A836L6G7_9TRYP|nr:hypothetical protein JKF63_00071 [Porcisia hertigi]